MICIYTINNLLLFRTNIARMLHQLVCLTSTSIYFKRFRNKGLAGARRNGGRNG